MTDSDVDRFHAEAMQNPEYAAAYHDAGERHELRMALVNRREQLGLTVADIALAIDCKPDKIRDIERQVVDPRLSTLQRYARAVGLHLTVLVGRDRGDGLNELVRRTTAVTPPSEGTKP